MEYEMSRSKRRNPLRGVTTVESEKSDKALSHRKLRRAVRIAVTQDKVLLPDEKELINPWNMSKDGKYRFDPFANPELMRK